MTSPLYRVRDWDEHFSVADLRKIKGPWRWVPLPTRHDTKGYRRLIRKPEGMAMYGTWCVLLAVAAKCSPPGTLQDQDGALSPDDISDKTGAPTDLVTQTMTVLSDPTEGIHWLEVVTGSVNTVNIAGNFRASPEKSAYKQARQASKTSKQDKQVPVSSSSKKPKFNYYTWITSEDLSNPAKVLDWHGRVSKVENSPVKNSDGSRISTLAAASLAVEHGDNPMAWFVSCVKSKFEFVTMAAEDTARQTLKSLRGNSFELFGQLAQATVPVAVPDDSGDDPSYDGEGDE